MEALSEQERFAAGCIPRDFVAVVLKEAGVDGAE